MAHDGFNGLPTMVFWHGIMRAGQTLSTVVGGPFHFRRPEMATAYCAWENVVVNGKVVKISAQDMPLVDARKWYLTNHGKKSYVATSYWKNGRRQTYYLHRLIMGDIDCEVDHINGDTLDNRRENLRLVTHQENCWNMTPRKDGSSKYKGVYWSQDKQSWVVQIMDRGKFRTVNGIANEEIAARIYDLMAEDRWGKYARLNFPKEMSCEHSKVV